MSPPRRTAAILLLAAAVLPAAVKPAPRPDEAPPPAPRYRLEYEIRGGAITRLLFLFPLRVYYEAAAAVDLTAAPAANGAVAFSFAGLPRTAYVMRTLGFSGKTMALLTLDESADPGAAEAFRSELLSQWQARAPEFADRARKVKKFSHRLLASGPRPFDFYRDASGLYRDVSLQLAPRYVYHPARTGIYFRIFPTLVGLLKFLNHPFLPAAEAGREGIGPLPASWEGDSLDYSADLNFLARQIEAAVESLVTVRQKSPFRMRFRVASRSGDEIEILGAARPDTPLWKGFLLREVRRIIRLRPGDRQLLSEEFRMEIRNKKGQGGSGRLLLTLIPPKEDPR
jgi:hypothetical protein